MGIINNIDKLIRIFSQAEKTEISPSTSASSFKERDVLVGVVRNKKQFNLMMQLIFYHIPMSQLVGCDMPIRYVAVYQSKKLFGRKAGVAFFGEVEGYKTVLRSEIKEIPKNTNEPYLYIKIKRWHKLSKTIEANEMDKTAVSTTKFLLENSKTSSELNIRTKEEFDFYQRLLKIVKDLVKNRIPNHEDVVYKDYTVKLKDGMIYLYFCEVLQYVIGFDLFLQKPTDVIKDIFDYYPEI